MANVARKAGFALDLSQDIEEFAALASHPVEAYRAAAPPTARAELFGVRICEMAIIDMARVANPNSGASVEIQNSS